MKPKKKSKYAELRKIACKGGICAMCGETKCPLTVDHIVPVQILNMLDETGDMQHNYEYNFQLLCIPCNTFKGNNLDMKNPKTKEILLKLLNKDNGKLL